MTIAPSPDPGNYVVGKGIVSFKRDGAADFVDMGNVSEMEFTAAIEKLDHFSNRSGVKKKDKTIVISKSGTLRLVLDEWTAANLALALLGTVTELESPDGAVVIDIFDNNTVAGELKFVATNEVGPKWNLHFYRVEFGPGKSFSPLSDEFAGLEIEGEVTARVSDGKFGIAEYLGA